MKSQLLMLGLIIALTGAGCLDYTQEITVNPDGSGSSTVDFGMSSALLAMEGGNNADGRLAASSKFIALRDRLKANPAVSDARYREYSEGDLQHFVITITLPDVTRLNGLQDELAGGTNDAPADSGSLSRLTMLRRADGSIDFRYLLAMSRSALPAGTAAGGDGQLNEATLAMVKSAFADRYFTVRLRGPLVSVPAAALPHSSAAADGSLVEWRIPFTELLSGGEFSRELLATVSPAALNPPRDRIAGARAPEPAVRAVYTGSVVPTLPDNFIGNYQQRLPLY